MKDENQKYETFETIEILENATVIFNDGDRKLFDAVRITDKEIIIGSINNHKMFVEWGGIPKENIKHIKHGTKRKINKKKS